MDTIVYLITAGWLAFMAAYDGRAWVVTLCVLGSLGMLGLGIRNLLRNNRK